MVQLDLEAIDQNGQQPYKTNQLIKNKIKKAKTINNNKKLK